MDTKFAKSSILGKPILLPPRNQSVVRQPNVFKSERPNFSKPRFASQVDVNNVLSKPVTPHYLPKIREYMLAKPHHVIAPGPLISMDKSKITRKQSKASKHGHENQKSTKPKPQKTKALANFHLQGPILQFPKVIYNLKERKEIQ
ncbi:hypothetical protein Tco_0101830, partial [Tanacetum coccineum]